MKSTAAENIVFYYNRQPVGVFNEITVPLSSGKYFFEIFRSMGARDLIVALKTPNPQQCYCLIKRRKYYFLAIALEEFKVIDIAVD